MKLALLDWIQIEGNVDTNTNNHTQILKIGENNILDLNSRWNNLLPIMYNVEKSRFEPSDYTDKANYGVIDALNKYISWFLAKGKEREFQIQTYLRGIENTFRQLKTDLHYIQLTNGLNDNHKSLVENFINQYEMFSPKGILNEDELKSIQKTLNIYCQNLRMEFLNDREGEWFLDFETDLVEVKKEAVQPKSFFTQKIEALYALWIMFYNKLFKISFRTVKAG